MFRRGGVSQSCGGIGGPGTEKIYFWIFRDRSWRPMRPEGPQSKRFSSPKISGACPESCSRFGLIKQTTKHTRKGPIIGVYDRDKKGVRGFDRERLEQAPDTPGDEKESTLGSLGSHGASRSVPEGP